MENKTKTHSLEGLKNLETYFFGLEPIVIAIEDYVFDTWPEARHSRPTRLNCATIAKQVTQSVIRAATTPVWMGLVLPEPMEFIEFVVESNDISFKRTNNTAAQEIAHQLEHVTTMAVIAMVTSICPHIDAHGTFFIRFENSTDSFVVCILMVNPNAPTQPLPATYAALPAPTTF